jgi:hypothetical protein
MRRRSTLAALVVFTASLLTLLAVPTPAGAAGPNPVSPTVSDSFNRPDANGLGVADTGQTWTSEVGVPATAGGRAVLGGGYEVASVGSGLSDGVAEVTVASAGPEFWLVTRLSDSTNYWRFGRSGGGPYVLQQIIGNVIGTAQVDVLAAVTPENGDRLSCALTSADLTCSVDGVPVTRTADAFNRTAVRHGLAGYASPESSFDDFVVGTPVVSTGCTSSDGYWKTHTRFGPARYDDTWAALPNGEFTTFARSGLPYFAALWMPPLGNGYFVLAHQYIAAELNGLSGASVPAPVAAAMSEAATLFRTYNPLQVAFMRGSNPVRARFVALAAVIEDYNEGVTGPGACGSHSRT